MREGLIVMARSGGRFSFLCDGMMVVGEKEEKEGKLRGIDKRTSWTNTRR